MSEAILFTVAALLTAFAMSVVQTRIFRTELRSLEQSRHCLGTICDYLRAKYQVSKEQHKLVLDLYTEEKKRSAALLGTVRALRREARRLQAVEVSASADRFWKPICAHGAEHGDCLRCAHKVPR